VSLLGHEEIVYTAIEAEPIPGTEALPGELDVVVLFDWRGEIEDIYTP
jgi:hypothetical protein